MNLVNGNLLNVQLNTSGSVYAERGMKNFCETEKKHALTKCHGMPVGEWVVFRIHVRTTAILREKILFPVKQQLGWIIHSFW